MLLAENSYGILKRFNFLKSVIERYRPESVLDIGCGGGTYLTVPLAEHFPAISFWGADSDLESIQFAQEKNKLKNLTFCLSAELNEDARFDLIIASEVIEHVDAPEQFILHLKTQLSDAGILVLTLPNGYGPFEIMCLFESILQFSGISTLLRKVRELIGLKAEDLLPENVDTLAVSPHINFFSYGQIKGLIANTGFSIIKYQPRTFLCGYGLDQLLRGSRLLYWNARLADYLPPFMNSDWMFVLRGRVQSRGARYKRNLYARIRKYLNEKRSGL